MLNNPLKFVDPTGNYEQYGCEPNCNIEHTWQERLSQKKLANNRSDDFALPLDPDDNNPSVAGELGGTRQRGLHPGVDLSVADGTAVMAYSGGIVVGTGLQDGGFGNYITVKHEVEGITYYSVYGHLQQTDVAVGDIVLAGDQIGLSNNTGGSEGPHLHFEIRRSYGFNEDTGRFKGDYWPDNEEAINALYVSPAMFTPEFNEAYGGPIETEAYSQVWQSHRRSFLHDLQRIPK